MGFRAGDWLQTALAKGLITPTSRTPTVSAPALDCTEKQFQAALMKLAEEAGWLAFHVYNSRRSKAGFPDVVAVRRGVLLFAELKTAKGKFATEQETWLSELACVPSVLVKRWRPVDWPDVVATLTGSPATHAAPC